MAITLSILGVFAKFFHCGKQQNPTKLILGYPPHLKYVAALPWKVKNQKFAILMHAKGVSNVTFYHLSKYQKNKCNTMQNANILLFVRSLSLIY